MDYTIKQYRELESDELYSILRLRAIVFIVEQECAYNDLDNLDQDAVHIMAAEDERITGYIRLLRPGTRYESASLSRITVHPDYRFRGLAGTLMHKAIDYIVSEWKENTIYISAQLYLQDFYESLGFKPVTDEYLEDGIPHVGMELKT